MSFFTTHLHLNDFHTGIINFFNSVPGEKIVDPQFYQFKHLYYSELGCYLYWIRIAGQLVPFTLDVYYDDLNHIYSISSQDRYIRDINNDMDKEYWRKVCIAANHATTEHNFDFIVDTYKILNGTGIIKEFLDNTSLPNSFDPKDCEIILYINNLIPSQNRLEIARQFTPDSAQFNLTKSEVNQIEATKPSFESTITYYNAKAKPRQKLDLMLQTIYSRLGKEYSMGFPQTKQEINNLLSKHILPDFKTLSSQLIDHLINDDLGMRMLNNVVQMYWSLTFNNKITIACIINHRQVIYEQGDLGGNVFQLLK